MINQLGFEEYAERRNGSRRTSNTTVTGVSLGKGPAFFIGGKVLNVSMTGLAMRLQEEYESGTVLLLSFGDCKRSARVIYTRPDSDGWIAGCQFISPLSHQELDLIDAP